MYFPIKFIYLFFLMGEIYLLMGWDEISFNEMRYVLTKKIQF